MQDFYLFAISGNRDSVVLSVSVQYVRISLERLGMFDLDPSER